MKTPLPKISIVTPSFNQGPFLKKAIQSVLDQEYPNFEHIIIDNCSTDESAEVLASFPHLRIVSEPDEGQSDAINKGFEMAEGDIIGWLNADDFYYPNTFSSVAENLSSKEVDAVYADIHFIDKDDKILRKLTSHPPLKHLILFYTYIQSTSFFFKRKVLDEKMRIDKSLHLNMDKEFFARLLYNNYKLKYVPEVYAAFRWHADNKSKPGKEVRSKTLSEDLQIFNRYMGTKLKENPRNLAFMNVGNHSSKVVRQLLKLIG
ncbi:MAG: glycosyltransferase family 2 protein [Bacteroidota bacterium]